MGFTIIKITKLMTKIITKRRKDIKYYFEFSEINSTIVFSTAVPPVVHFNKKREASHSKVPYYPMRYFEWNELLAMEGFHWIIRYFLH